MGRAQNNAVDISTVVLVFFLWNTRYRLKVSGCMEELQLELLKNGLSSSYIDGHVTSDRGYEHAFVRNNKKYGYKVLTSIEDELLRCDSFVMSIAFVTQGGITPLLQTFKELEKRGVPGRILTTNYLTFSDPYALKKLHGLSNITVRMFDAQASEVGFHTKGYIFQQKDMYRMIIGSSNLTKKAMSVNHEWNTKIVATKDGRIVHEVMDEFEELWNDDLTYDYEDIIDTYKEQYSIVQRQQKLAKENPHFSLKQYRLQPNSMQVGFIRSLRSIVEQSKDRALLISATGTGKTYASAFAMRELGFKRVLFLVHRNSLASQTLRSYSRVFDLSVSMGLIGNGKFDTESDYLFATVQTLAKDDKLGQFDPKSFDCIILDEAHHASSSQYQKIMKYFEPKLWLGMTATPDKQNDDVGNNNIYKIFNYEIVYEIRLQQAMEENLLCPFHYFGISDLQMISDGKDVSFSQLTSDERIKHILEMADYYGYSGSRVKGVIFCSRVKETEELSRKFNGLGLRTVALNGSASEAERQDAFERLAMEEEEATEDREPLDYIFSVDILNEGVDIVEINQVIMLRPTQSPIVFIQQLGRGLRKAIDKEFVVILDFIANYEKNFLIPIALSGDRTFNKDNVRRYVMEGCRIIPGASTVHFDEVSRKRIFSAIDNANFNDVRLIKENYIALKNKLGHIPRLMDFDAHGEMDVLRIFDSPSLGSYYMFLKKHEKAYTVRLSAMEEKYVEFISKKFASGKRVQELLVLKRILDGSCHLFKDLDEGMATNYKRRVSEEQKTNIIHILTNEFPTGSSKGTYKECIFIARDGDDYRADPTFASMLENEDFYRIVEELIAFGIFRYERDYKGRYKDRDLVLYQKYTYEDVCRLLNWEHNEVPLNIGGYKFDKKTKTFPVFINYEKAADISDTTKYEDHFVDRSSLIAISKSGRTLESEDVQNFMDAQERGIDVELFVRKNKDDKESKEFYYLGPMRSSGRAKEFVMPNTNKGAVELEWNLDVSVREDIYEYIIN